MATKSQDEWTHEEFLEQKRPRKFELRVYEDDARGPYGHLMMVLAATDTDGHLYLCGNPRWKRIEGVGPAVEFLSLPKEQGQQWFDALWRAGLRPSGVDTKNEVPNVAGRLVSLEARVSFIMNAVEFLADQVERKVSTGVAEHVRRILTPEK